MKFNKSLSFFAIISFLTLSIFSFNVAAQTFENDTNNPANQFAGNSVEGVWELNLNESDDPMRKIQTLIQKSFAYSGKAESSEQTKTPGISISMFPPERLVLAGSKNEMTINEFYPDFISTRTIKTDGQTHIYPAGNKAEITVDAIREKNNLSIETLSPRGNHMTETFELFADGRKLKITVRISDANFQELLTLQRIYDRTILDDLSDYN